MRCVCWISAAPHEPQLLQAVGFLNKHGFAHLDIKRENVVLEPINEATEEHTFEQLFAPLQCANQAAGTSHAAVDCSNIRVSFAFLSLLPLPQQRTGPPHRFRPCGTHAAHAALMSQHPKIRGDQQLGRALPQGLQRPRSKYVLNTSRSINSRLMHFRTTTLCPARRSTLSSMLPLNPVFCFLMLPNCSPRRKP